MNPLMQAMGGNPINNIQSLISQIGQLKKMFSGDPSAAVQIFAQKNPQFAQFVKDNENKSPEQIAKDYGLDWDSIKGFLK